MQHLFVHPSVCEGTLGLLSSSADQSSAAMNVGVWISEFLVSFTLGVYVQVKGLG